MENNTTSQETLFDEVHDDDIWLITLRFVVVGVGIILNTIVSGVFVYIRMYRKSLIHGLIVQQSFVDLVGCCLFLFFYNQDAPDGNTANAFCKARMLFWFSTATSTYNLVMITVERYIAVVHPFIYRKRNIGSRSRLFFSIPYIIGLSISTQLGILAESNPELPGECRYNYPNRATSLFSGLCIFILYFFLPTIFMIICYQKMLTKVRERRKPLQPEHISMRKKSQHVSIRRNLVYTMFFVVIAFVCTTSPNFIMYLVYNICLCFEFSTIVEHELTVLLYTFNMCINPIIYGTKMTEFRNGLRTIWRHTFGDSEESVSRTGSSSSWMATM